MLTSEVTVKVESNLYVEPVNVFLLFDMADVSHFLQNTFLNSHDVEEICRKSHGP